MGRSNLAAAALPLILILAACSSGGGASSAPTAPPSQPTTPSAAPSTGGGASPSATAGDQIELKVATGSGSIGKYLTGADEMTLYIFTKDTKDSGKSVCNGDCATNWPPLIVASLDEVKADSGATGTLALVTRDDGKKMVSYNGMPLYYFAADKAAGDTTGQGVGDVWFVAAP